MTGPRELIVDLFAGGGGASTAILAATGRHPDVAVNHNAAAIGVHQANHPSTRHYTCDVREVDPVQACSIDGVQQPVGLMWASPDCTHFSKARGGKPVEKGIRSLADVVVVWARAVRPRLIHLENVEEFQDWGPVLDNGQPCPESKGLDFRRWVKDLEALGYVVDWRELVAADYGAPTTRKRLFLIARCDGEPIRWPQPTHASRAKLAKGDLFNGHLKPWRAAAEIIDWSIPVPSIFGRKRPLKPKTQARIAKGLKRYVIDTPTPFIVPVTHTADGARSPRSAAEPLQTITRAKGGELAVAAPSILPVTHAGSDERVYDPRDPLRTITGANRGEIGLASAMLVPRYGERDGQEPRVRDIGDPYPVVVPTGNGGDLASVYLEQANTRDVGADAGQPARTITGKGKQGVVAAQLGRETLIGGASVGVGGRAGQSPPRGLGDPLHTVTAKADRAVTTAFLKRQFGSTVSGRDLHEPAPVVMPDGTGGKVGVVAAFMQKTEYGGANGANVWPEEEPLRTATATGGFSQIAASMIQHNGDQVGRPATEPLTTLTHRCTQQQVLATTIDKYYGSGVAADVEEPPDTATDKARFGLVGAFMEQANTGMVGHPMERPLSTIVGGGGEHVGWGSTQRLIEVGMVPANDDGSSARQRVIEFLWEHFGEPTEGEWADPTGSPGARLKFGLVILGGAVWQIVDIGMRMLVPRELFNAQGFPPTYIIEVTFDGRPVTKTAQTSMAGNSVSPPPAEASLRANLTWMDLPERIAA
ncbi:MAG: methyltransferase [Phenylobacterium sp.]|nr:methyltransferase [Phenylobacterium sp.]